VRQFAGIGLLLFFAFTMAGIYPAHWALRRMAHRDMKALVRTGGYQLEGLAELSFKLVRGNVTDPGFMWEEEGEFSFNDRLYDVIDSRVTGDIVTFRCLPDGREDALVHFAKRLDPFRSGDRSADSSTPLMLKLIVDQFMGPANDPPCLHEPAVVAFAESGPALLLTGFERVQLRPPTA
jgi:hypothetical protein